MDIEIGRLGLSLDGICYYGKNRVVFPFPIQLGLYAIKGVSEEKDIRLVIVKERKKHYGIAYDDRLGMVGKFEIPNVHVIPIVLEIVSRKFKLKTKLSEMRSITKNGVTTTRRVWLDKPDAVEESELRRFLSRK